MANDSVSKTPAENQNTHSKNGYSNKNKRYWKAFRIVAVAGIIEAISLVLWCKSEDFNQVSAYFIRWIADCGFLSGGAYLAHKLTGGKYKRFMIAAIWCVWAAFCLVLYVSKSSPEPDPYRPLIPANDPFPPLPDGRIVDGVRSNVVVFFFGGCVNASIVRDHPIPIVVTPEGDPKNPSFKHILEVSIKNGQASVSGQFFDKDGKIVAVLRDNKPIINLANSFDIQRPDSSTLIVHDEYDVEALNIRFLRPQVFMFTGTIRSPDGSEVVITKQYADFTKGAMQGKMSGMSLMGSAICLGKNMQLIGLTGPGISN